MEYVSDAKTEVHTAAAFEIFGALVLAAGALILAYDGFGWLKTGEWSSMSLLTIGEWAGWNYPYLEWRGAQEIFDFVMQFPLWLITGLVGTAIMSIASSAKSNASGRLAALKHQRGAD
ncbi:MAG: hypothetical protein WAU78_17555 [Roseiarcus sp.]